MSQFEPEKPLIAFNTWDVDTDCLPPEAITMEAYGTMGGIPVSHSAQTEENWEPGVIDGNPPPTGTTSNEASSWSNKAAFN